MRVALPAARTGSRGLAAAALQSRRARLRPAAAALLLSSLQAVRWRSPGRSTCAVGLEWCHSPSFPSWRSVFVLRAVRSACEAT
eukprot:3262957-Rhodomonas_salina.2